MDRRVHRQIDQFAGILAAFVAMVAMLWAGTAQATSYVVNTLNDKTGVAGFCSLRDAIDAGNGFPDGGSSCTTEGSGTDTITFSVTGKIVLGATLEISDNNLTITGPSGGLTIDGAGAIQLIAVGRGSTVYLDDLTLANGRTNPQGGAIDNRGSLTVLNSTLNHNIATYDGAGILNDGTLTIINSTFYDNSSIFSGVGSGGGAIFQAGGTLTVVNSTFYRNATGGDGGGAIAIFDGTAVVQNTILVDNRADSAVNNCSTVVKQPTDGGYNVSDDTSCGFGDHFIQVGSASDVLNTTAALTNNGGPTQTITDFGPAVDAIPASQCTYPGLSVNPCANPLVQFSPPASSPLTCDQRGKPRPDPGDPASQCDVGAFQQPETFARFRVQAEIDLPDHFRLLGEFRLAAGGIGIDPPSQRLMLTVGPGRLTIPAGSFHIAPDEFVFRGKVGRVDVQADIAPVGRDHYQFIISGQGLDLSGVKNPVSVSLQIGHNQGSARIDATIRPHFLQRHHHHL
jgi:CSLREA domain-containing protein